MNLFPLALFAPTFNNTLLNPVNTITETKNTIERSVVLLPQDCEIATKFLMISRLVLIYYS